jgi:hypothetical protein
VEIPVVYLGRILALSQILTSGNERVGSLLLGESDELDRMDEDATGDEGTSFLQSGLDCCLPGLPDFREPLLLILRHCGDFYGRTTLCRREFQTILPIFARTASNVNK